MKLIILKAHEKKNILRNFVRLLWTRLWKFKAIDLNSAFFILDSWDDDSTDNLITLKTKRIITWKVKSRQSNFQSEFSFRFSSWSTCEKAYLKLQSLLSNVNKFRIRFMSNGCCATKGSLLLIHCKSLGTSIEYL